jgi:hypothetical protein
MSHCLEALTKGGCSRDGLAVVSDSGQIIGMITAKTLHKAYSLYFFGANNNNWPGLKQEGGNVVRSEEGRDSRPADDVVFQAGPLVGGVGRTFSGGRSWSDAVPTWVLLMALYIAGGDLPHPSSHFFPCLNLTLALALNLHPHLSTGLSPHPLPSLDHLGNQFKGN